MPRKESRKYKALYFDIRIKDLEKHYSSVSPKGAYGKIKTFLTKRNFSHEQYSGYHSKYKTTDLEIFDLIREMSDCLPWLKHCINHFEVTNIGANHDLLDLFMESFDDPDVL
ncbi:MAG: hypothetical protein ACRC3H_20935 [Lachnospiraceae bacterium]